MKKNYIAVVAITTITGILIGNIIKEDIIHNKMYINKDKITKKEIKIVSNNINNLEKDKQEINKELGLLKQENKDIQKQDKLHAIKEESSYTEIKGEGLVIDIDSTDQEVGNIASFMEYKKIFINLINEIKLKGGKFISINGQRINQYSEIVLAGNHININSIPIAPPYKIEVIGDIDTLQDYIEEEYTYIDFMRNEYPIKVDIKTEKNIKLEKIVLSSKFDYLRGE